MPFVSLATSPYPPPSAPEKLYFTLLWKNIIVILLESVSIGQFASQQDGRCRRRVEGTSDHKDTLEKCAKPGPHTADLTPHGFVQAVPGLGTDHRSERKSRFPQSHCQLIWDLTSPGSLCGE